MGVTTDKNPGRTPARRWRASMADGRGVIVAEGFGPTATAAKDALSRAVCTRLSTAGEEPSLVRAMPGLAALIYAQDGGWVYRLVIQDVPGGACSGWESRREAEIRARRHLAQLVYDELPDEGGMATIHPDDKDGRMEHARWLTWQRAYKAARGRGLGDGPAREEANRCS